MKNRIKVGMLLVAFPPLTTIICITLDVCEPLFLYIAFVLAIVALLICAYLDCNNDKVGKWFDSTKLW